MIKEIGLGRNPFEHTAIAGRDIFEERPYGVWRWGRAALRWRRFRENYHRAANMEIVPGYPLQINVGLNAGCNLRCQHCIQREKDISERRMPWGMFTRIVDESADNGLCSMKFNSSNEPLLRSDIAKFISYARGRKILNTYFATNGTIFNDRVMNELIDAGLSKIMFSIDAITPGTYLRMRNSGEYYTVVKNVHSFIEMREKRGTKHPRVRVSFLETELNGHEKGEFVNYWSRYADSIGIQKLLNTPKTEFRRWAPREYCSFPFKLLTVKSSGTIYQCCAFSGEAIGVIGSISIKKAWNSERMTAIRIAQIVGNLQGIESCSKCLGV